MNGQRWSEEEPEPMTPEEVKKQKAREWRSRNPDKVREAVRKWRREHPEKIREYNRRWREEHPEKTREYDRRWREKYPEKWRAAQKRYREKHPEKVRELHLRWISKPENHEKYLAYKKEYRKRKRLERIRAEALAFVSGMDVPEAVVELLIQDMADRKLRYLQEHDVYMYVYRYEHDDSNLRKGGGRHGTRQ